MLLQLLKLQGFVDLKDNSTCMQAKSLNDPRTVQYLEAVNKLEKICKRDLQASLNLLMISMIG